jgi:hypothetical protein
VGKEQGGQHKRADHLDILRPEQHSSAVQAIREDAPDQREQNDGQLTEKEIQPQVEGVFGEIVNQPALRKLLNERSNRRGARPQPHHAEVAVTKGPESASEEG